MSYLRNADQALAEAATEVAEEKVQVKIGHPLSTGKWCECGYRNPSPPSNDGSRICFNCCGVVELSKPRGTAEVDWGDVIAQVAEGLELLRNKPAGLKIGFQHTPGGILNAYREGDLNFREAVVEMEKLPGTASGVLYGNTEDRMNLAEAFRRVPSFQPRTATGIEWCRCPETQAGETDTCEACGKRVRYAGPLADATGRTATGLAGAAMEGLSGLPACEATGHASMMEHERRAFWREVFVGVDWERVPGDTVHICNSRCAEFADAALAEFDKRFK